MLRRLDLKRPWRSLDKSFWQEDLPAGRRTVVYGHNGSGKSTLSELLLSISEGNAATDLLWEHDDKRVTSVAVGGPAPSPSIAVFTRRWVESNLAEFLDGAGASAIVTLGREAIDAKEEEARLAIEIAHLKHEAKESEAQRRAASENVKNLVREVQDKIVSELQAFDFNHFTRNRYSVKRVQTDLSAYEGAFPDSSTHAEALKRLREGAPTPVEDTTNPPADTASPLVDISALLAETPTRVALSSLEGNATAGNWVEQGLNLHGSRDHCLFCAGNISSERRAELARHFDQSWFDIRSQATTRLAAVRRKKEELLKWKEGLPSAKRLSDELRFDYERALESTRADVDKRVSSLQSVENALKTKIDDPSATPETPDLTALESDLLTTPLSETVNDHNSRVSAHEAVTKERLQTVLDHLIGSHHERFRSIENQVKECARICTERNRAAGLAERRLEKVRQSRFSTATMAENLTRDLARVYGKNHLSVNVTEDGKSYACRRGDDPATDLSDGERTTLSLLYFLRRLEDERLHNNDQSQRLVVIDDPSSSLDREALFATHQWLIDTLGGFGQYIVLTHDFGLLRLFLKSHRNAWGTSMSKIKKEDANEIRFPKVAFLEIYAATVDGERRSKVGKLPRVLLTNTSEYAYLFSMVMAGIADSEDHDRLFLLPNATRRVLEVFASYKAPHRTDFLQQLEALVQSQDGEPFRDVYDFCNRFSHGEGSESTDVLDARAVHGQIRRCMEFLREVDSEHFERMCAATEVDPATLS